MKTESRMAKQFNLLLNELYSLSSEIQILLCVAVWTVIGVFLRALYVQGDADATLMVWIVLFILINGMLSGLIVAMLVAIIATVIMSPYGLFGSADFSLGELGLRSIAMLCGAGIGGGMKRLIQDLNNRLYNIEHKVQGTELPNYLAAIKHLEKLIKSRKTDSPELDVLNVQLENIEQIRKLVGQKRADKQIKEFADILKEKLGSSSHISQTSANHLLGLLSATEGVPLEIEKILQSVAEEAASRNIESTPNIESSANVERRSLEGIEQDPQQWIEEVIERAVERFYSRPEAQVKKVITDFEPKKDNKYFLGDSVSCRKLEEGLQSGEIVVEYVPRLNVNSGYFSALEAVIVWHHPQRGKLELNDFLVMLDVPKAKLRLYLWAIRQALNDVDEWFELGHLFTISLTTSIDERVDVSLLELLLQEMRQRPRKTGWLALEFSETSLSRAEPKAIELLRYVQQYGGTVTVSSYVGSIIVLSKVFLLPVDAVKLSPTILAKAISHSDQRRELGSLIKLIHSRGLIVIADGIESSAVIRMLRPYGCDELLGPFLSRSIEKEHIPWGRIRA